MQASPSKDWCARTTWAPSDGTTSTLGTSRISAFPARPSHVGSFSVETTPGIQTSKIQRVGFIFHQEEGVIKQRWCDITDRGVSITMVGFIFASIWVTHSCNWCCLRAFSEWQLFRGGNVVTPARVSFFWPRSEKSQLQHRERGHFGDPGGGMQSLATRIRGVEAVGTFNHEIQGSFFPVPRGRLKPMGVPWVEISRP